MFVHFNLLSVNCLKSDDGFLSPFSEFYWTWSVYSESSDETVQVSKGFSAGCPIDEGYLMKAEEGSNYRSLNDPKFTLELPHVNNGETKKITIELNCWESDYSTIDIKKSYSNNLLQSMIKLFEEQKLYRNELIDEIENLIENEDNSYLDIVKKTGIINASFITVSKAVLPLLSLAE